MRRLVSFVISLALPLAFIGIPAAILILGRTQFDDFLTASSGVWPIVFERTPFIVFALAAILGWHFNQTKVTFISLLCAGVYLECLLHNKMGLFQMTLCGLSFCIAYPTLFLLRERRMLSLSGVLKLLFIAGLLAAAWFCQPSKAIERFVESPISPNFLSDKLLEVAFVKRILVSLAQHLNGSAFILIVAALASLVLMGVFGSSPTHRVLKKSLLASLVASLLGLSGIAGWWPKGMVKPTMILYFYSSGILLLYAVYSLSWGRAYTDELTGRANRRALEEALNHLGRRYTVAMIDIDHFKKFNDTYGHSVGDDVLRFVAYRMSREGIGKVYRYGGEEFTILCPRKKAQSLEEPLNQLRENIAQSKLVIRNRPRDRSMRGKGNSGTQKKVSVTISIGVAERDKNRSNPQEVIAAADKALYAAKKQGRNRVVISQ